MKAAKFIICCLMAALIVSPFFRALPSGNTSAYAETFRYARADSKNVYFYEKQNLDYALFTIPYTYCVEILATDGEWYYVRYAEDTATYRALYGYCLADKLTPVETPPENVYLNWTVTITVKTETPVGSLPVSSDISLNAAFYGTYYSGTSAYSYVLYDNKFYYIYGANDNYPLNEIAAPPVPEDPAEEAGGSNKILITVLILAALAAGAIIIIYLTGRTKRFRPER